MRAAFQFALAAVAAASVVVPGGQALAFGPTGHRIVGTIAENHLCAGARAGLEPLLDGAGLAEAGLWADEIRADPAWQHAAPWHFINVADGGSIAGVAAADDANVMAALERYEGQLRDPRLPVGQRAIALRFVAHFVADIHQPLHVGRAEDRGGNTVDVLVNGERMSLHALWDGEALLAMDGLKARDHARSLEGLAVGLPGSLQAAGPLAWAEESRALRPYVYAFPAGVGQNAGRAPRLSRTYLAGARNIVNLRLAEAGLRLASRLNALWCAPARPEGH